MQAGKPTQRTRAVAATARRGWSVEKEQRANSIGGQLLWADTCNHVALLLAAVVVVRRGQHAGATRRLVRQ